MAPVPRQQARMLYRRVMKAHLKFLEEPMRSLGDGMFRSEFRRHVAEKGGATLAQWDEFESQWNAYCNVLSSMHQPNER